MKQQMVVWYEGMKLNPHHFQQADRFTQYLINSKIGYINPNLWGIKELLVDNAALAAGTFAIVKCSGIMPDGLIINMPENDNFPKTRNFADHFAAIEEKLDVYLTVPAERQIGGNCLLSESNQSNDSRYFLQNQDLLDFNTGSNMRTIGIVRPNFLVKFGDESLDDLSGLKIGEIVRNSEGKYNMHKSYIPPVLSVDSSETLKDYIREVLSAMISKSKELRNQAGIQKPELSMMQVEILLMLQTINSFIPVLNYYYQSSQIHPENLYLLFLNLAGELSTYSNMGIKAGEIPLYDHKHLSEIFKQLVDELLTMLSVQKTLTRRDINIPLRKQGETLFVGQLSPNQMNAQFYLSVQGDISEKKIITELPKNIKISSYEEIIAVHQAGIQGVAIEYIARPQTGISINERAQYFKILKEGRFWDKIVSKNNIAFFLAAEFKPLQIELILLMPGD